ncbi:DUF5655 domain-containing protein [Marinifilum sp. RC60d5]|uniref:DUF5655 domain-containing protein n=1 Tax=Marinifilum sp. RC60d5 TaxID=3458414 RepID=UPI004036FA9B
MSWICPKCKRVLPGPNQYHSCYVTTKENHTTRMSTTTLETFELLLSYLNSFENIEIIYLKTCIQFKIEATFLSVYPRKNYLNLEYQLNKEDDQFPVHKCIRISKNRVLHRLTIAECKDIDEQLKIWIKDAYWTIRKK